MTGIRISSWDGADDQLAQAADLYAETFAEPPYGDDVAASRASVLERIRRYARTKPEFRLLLAWDGPELVGLVLGTGIAAGDWWRDRIAPLMSEDQRTQWLGEECFSVAELAVSPSHRRAGVARALMTAVVAALPYPTAVLGCHQDAVPARRLYASLGWESIVAETRSDGTTLHVLGKRMPEPAGSSVEG
ncbi:GNAT family N-acetyltransferase [Microbacterium tumbae]